MATSVLAQKYKDEVVQQLEQDFEYRNCMQIPQISKVVVNCGVLESDHWPAALDHVCEEKCLPV